VRHDLLDDCDIGCGKRDKGNFPPLAVLSTPCFRAGGWPCSVWLRVEEKSPPYEAALHCNHKRAREKSVSAVSGWPLRPPQRARTRSERLNGATREKRNDKLSRMGILRPSSQPAGEEAAKC
jgi:hypothetical protein